MLDFVGSNITYATQQIHEKNLEIVWKTFMVVPVPSAGSIMRILLLLVFGQGAGQPATGSRA